MARNVLRLIFLTMSVCLLILLKFDLETPIGIGVIHQAKEMLLSY